jgi:hypothetical protein
VVVQIPQRWIGINHIPDRKREKKWYYDKYPGLVRFCLKLMVIHPTYQNVPHRYIEIVKNYSITSDRGPIKHNEINAELNNQINEQNCKRSVPVSFSLPD